MGSCRGIREGKREDLQPLQTNKQAFIMDQVPAVPLAQLVDPVDTADEYQQGAGAQERHENLEPSAQRLLDG